MSAFHPCRSFARSSQRLARPIAAVPLRGTKPTGASDRYSDRQCPLACYPRTPAQPRATKGIAMPTELLVLGLGAVLLLVHVLLAGHYRTRQYGTAWNTGARDEAMPPLDPVPARLLRAQANYLETFPLVIVALLGVVVAGKTSELTAWGAWVWLGAR